MPQALGGARSETSDTRHIVAVDPGLVCGVAVYSFGFRGNIFSSTEFPWHSAVQYVERWLTEPNVHVVSERYTIPTGRSVVSSQLEAIECNGALSYVTARRGATFRLHPRAEPKKIVTNALLKKLGWYKKTKDDHANDAARHVGFMLLTDFPTHWLNITSMRQVEFPS